MKHSHFFSHCKKEGKNIWDTGAAILCRWRHLESESKLKIYLHVISTYVDDMLLYLDHILNLCSKIHLLVNQNYIHIFCSQLNSTWFISPLQNINVWLNNKSTEMFLIQRQKSLLCEKGKTLSVIISKNKYQDADLLLWRDTEMQWTDWDQ